MNTVYTVMNRMMCMCRKEMRMFCRAIVSEDLIPEKNGNN